MISDYYIGRSRNIEDLRKTSQDALSLSEFNNILWVGVFGSFSRDEQTDKSDVDIVVVASLSRTKQSEPSDPNEDPWTIEDLLPRVWSRPVEVVSVENDLHDLVSVDSLLTSRTIYGNPQCDEVQQLRHNAKKYLNQGLDIFNGAKQNIESLKSKISDLRDFEEFLGRPSLRQSSRDELLKILCSLDIEPTIHPIYEGFFTAVIHPANDISAIIASSSEEDTEYWRKIWEILSTSSPNSLQSLLMRLKKFVLPTLHDIEKRFKLSLEWTTENKTASITEDKSNTTAANETDEPALIETEDAAANIAGEAAASYTEELPSKLNNEKIVKEGAFKKLLGGLRARFSSRDR